MASDGSMQEFLTYKFVELRMNGYRQGGHGDPQIEDVSFSWRSVTVTYQGARGAAGFTTTNPDADAAVDAPVCAQLNNDTADSPGVTGFLDLPAAPGESTSKAHLNEIELQSFCFTSSTASPGGATFGSFTVEKRYDRSTPVLLDHMANAKSTLGAGTVTLTRPSQAGGVEDFLTFKFAGVRPDGFRQGGQGDPLAEDVSFDWTSVAVDYRPNVAGDTWSVTR
jgi:type VI protein secretion system component Hcp